MSLGISAARSSARWGTVYSLLIALLEVSGADSTAIAGGPYKGELRVAPRAIRYRYADDSFAHQESSVSMVAKPRAQGDLSYYGNRLTQFRYIGPPGQGGMYEAMEAYKAERPLDPVNYRYRQRKF